MMTRRKILISGGGIAGLTAALCLAKTGNRVDIFERAPALEEVGAGIQISPNAFHVLSGLGLSQELLAASSAPNSILIMNAVKGTQLASLPLGFHIQDKYNAPYLVIHRADLQNILLNACQKNADISISFGVEITDAAIHKNGVTALIKSGSEIIEQVGDVLVGADGVQSRIRSDILELPQAKYTGKIAWRALISADQIKMHEAMSNTVAWLGPKAHVVTYPVHNGEYLNVIAVTQEAKPSKADEISKTQLLETFSHWCDDVTKLFEFEANWSGWPLYETPSIYTMAYKSVALVGDAAHTMLPFAAQGAAQAIEDAYVLSQSLTQNNDVEIALKQFEQQRLPRVKRVVKAARTNGHIYHLSGISAFIRNIGLSKISGERLLQKQDWIYRWKP